MDTMNPKFSTLKERKGCLLKFWRLQLTIAVVNSIAYSAETHTLYMTDSCTHAPDT